MYGTRGAYVESDQYRAAVAAERAYWRRAGRGMVEPPKAHGNARAYAPELETVAATWGRLAWEKKARDLEEFAGNKVAALPFDASDDYIRRQASAIASGLYSRVADGVMNAAGARALCEGACAEWGVEPPKTKAKPLPGETLDKAKHRADLGALARMFSPDWWVRRLRASHGRRIESAAVGVARVHRGADCYVSAINLARRQDQKARNAKAMAGVSLVNQFDHEYTLAELAEKSNANPRVRSAELLTRIRGFELIAEGLGHVAEFWTMTAPSRMHAVKEVGPEGAKRYVTNRKWDGSTARDAQGWLCKQWARFRAWADREGIEFYGFRVAEPHHDGCPHWHLLLFMPADVADKARARFHACALVTPESERLRSLTKKEIREASPGMTWARAKEVRLESLIEADRIEAADEDRALHATKFERIDPERGGAVAYIIKYISKNIDGYKLDADLFGNEAVSASAKVEAWATTWRIRQFQQIGGAPVGAWRELRRLKEADQLSDTVEAARKAADVGKNSEYGKAGQGWADYVDIQGGPTVRRKELRIRVAYTNEGEKFCPVEECCEPAENCYGEPAPKSTYGVRDVRKAQSFLSRRFKWEVKRGRAGKVERIAAVVPGALPALPGVPGWGGVGVGVAPARAPRTRVNNCTRSKQDAGTKGGGFEGVERHRHGRRSVGSHVSDKEGDGGNGIRGSRGGAARGEGGALRPRR